MKHSAFFAILLIVPFFPTYAQEIQSNTSLHLDTVEVPFSAFNVVGRDAMIFNLEREHATNWQVTIENKIMYANPNGNAVLRLYEDLSSEKFIEIGMGSPPDLKFWVAVQHPETGYVVIHDRIKDGWKPGKVIIAAHSNNAGLSVNNGERIVVSNLDVDDFTIKAFSAYGMESSADPPAAISGSVVLDFVSGNPADNPLYYFPIFLIGGIVTLVIVLLKTKKRA
ncbi:MAG: hypothetical protein ACREAF_01435 [Nitrosopumilaceae archaeon]